jgi:GlpG protein
LRINNYYILIIIFAALLSVFSNFGYNFEIVRHFTFIDFKTSGSYLEFFTFDETYLVNNEWWRLISPIFIHFSLTHLAFNCLWIYILGSRIELLDGKLLFLLLVIFSGVVSNFAQYTWEGISLFGGLSGVVYGLLGFCYLIELDNRQERYGLPPAIYIFMVAWLILGFMGVLELFGFGSIANYAHLGGLISGLIFGMLTKLIQTMRKNETSS